MLFEILDFSVKNPTEDKSGALYGTTYDFFIIIISITIV